PPTCRVAVKNARGSRARKGLFLTATRTGARWRRTWRGEANARYRSVPARTRPGAAVDGGGRQVRRRQEAAGYRDRLQDRSSLLLPQVRQGRLPGARHRQEDLAPPQFLSARGLPARARRPHRLFCMALVKGMPVAAAARLIGEHDTRLWRVIQHYVETA